MALSTDQTQAIDLLIKKGGMSNRKIAKEVGCSESAVRQYIAKSGVQKNALRDLARDDVDNIIKKQEIGRQKNALSAHEKTHYDMLLLEEAQSRNLAFNVNQKILLNIMGALEDGTKDVKINSGDGMQVIQPMRHEPSDYLALSRAAQTATDSLGITNRHAPKQDITAISGVQTQAVKYVGFKPMDEDRKLQIMVENGRD